jgi:hypothetical protein
VSTTTTTALKAAFPSGPLTNDDGTVTPAWRGYFQALYVRTGNAPGASTSGLDASIADEANARASADAVLSNAIAAERTARETADSAEAAARGAGDSSKLPLIGGTLTGPLVGTLASFTTFQSASTAGPTWTSGLGVPTSPQPLGSLYSRTDGTVGATLYVSRGTGVWNAVAAV